MRDRAFAGRGQGVLAGRGRKRKPLPRRYAIFPGSFDPIHNGHVAMARFALRRYGLERVYLIPTARFLNRDAGIVLSGRWRVRLCRAAVRGERGLEVWGHEVEEDMPGYLIDTVRRVRRQWGEAEGGEPMGVIVGSDLLSEMAGWKDVESLRHLVHLYVLRRQGGARVDGAAEATLARYGFAYTVCNNPLVAASSTAIRARLAAGGGRGSLASVVPPRVGRLIRAHRLYGGHSVS